MNKQQFCKVIKELENNSAAIDIFHKAVSAFNPDNRIIGLSDGLVDSVIKLLDNCSEDEWVAWWIYETDYGHKKNMLDIKFDGIEMKIETPEQLYDLVWGNHD